MTKQPRDMERLLVWAVRDELPKAKPASTSAFGTIPSALSWLELGKRVQSSYRDPDFRLGDQPHIDAVKVGDAVAALPQDQSIADVNSVRALAPEFSLLTFLGEHQVMCRQFNLSTLVILNAVRGIRPAWDLGTPQLQPVRGEQTGKVELFGKSVGRCRYAEGSHSRIEYTDPTIAEVMDARAEYTVWRMALELLVERLRGTLTEYEPTGPSAPLAPWLSSEPQPRILRAVAA
jgi:hypothetical protein